MANLPETSTFEAAIYQLETTDPVQGGPEGIDNLQAKQLANRTRWLKTNVDNLLVSVGGLAPINSPAFTGTPTAPTQSPGNSSTRLATTAFVMAAVSAATGGGITNPNPDLQGIPTAPTAATSTNTTQIATTAFVRAAITAYASGGLSNPDAALTGAPTSTTPATSDNSTRIATTAFVRAAITNYAAGGLQNPDVALTGAPTAPTPTSTDNSTRLATTAFVRTAIVNYASGGLQNPDVALTGNPTAPTQAAGNNSTRIATTAFVTAAVSAASGAYLSNPSPDLTGTPTAPTAAAGTNTTQIATTAFVGTAITALKGIPPSALDTLQKLAASINNDPNFYTNVATANHTHAWSTITSKPGFLPNSGNTLLAAITVPSTVVITGAASGAEGGQVDLGGSGSNSTISVDNYNGQFRVFGNSVRQMVLDLNGLFVDGAQVRTGTVAVANGGTGGTTQASARSGLGLGSIATRDVTVSTAAASGTPTTGQIWLRYS